MAIYGPEKIDFQFGFKIRKIWEVGTTQKKYFSNRTLFERTRAIFRKVHFGEIGPAGPKSPKIEKIDFHQTHPKWPKFREKVENRKILARKVHFWPISADLDPEKKVPKNAFLKNF